MAVKKKTADQIQEAAVVSNSYTIVVGRYTDANQANKFMLKMQTKKYQPRLCIKGNNLLVTIGTYNKDMAKLNQEALKTAGYNAEIVDTATMA